MKNIPDNILDQELQEAWVDQLATAASQIKSIRQGYISDDGLDYLTSALDLSAGLSNDYVDGDLRHSKFLIDLAKPQEDQSWAEEGEILREIDNYASDGISDKLHELVNRIGEALY